MNEKEIPTGFVAICKCGKVQGAIDDQRTPRKDTGKIIGKWLMEGFSVHPKYGGSWQVNLSPCICGKQKEE